MQNQHGFASRFGDGKAASRRLRQLLAGGVALAICAGIQGCASDQSWPSLAKITDISNVMTPEQRQKALQELQKDGQSTPADAGQAAKQPQ
jgi:hypothetical protein